ncbi:MAG: hypothetical protein R6V75_04550 [Bacteroidales bacterium]
MMNTLEKEILRKVAAILGLELLEKVNIYLNGDLKPAGASVPAGDGFIDLPWEGHVVFVDLEPKANWGHPCQYLAIQQDGDDHIGMLAQMPPFLQSDDPTVYRLLWRGPLAPEWTVNA